MTGAGVSSAAGSPPRVAAGRPLDGPAGSTRRRGGPGPLDRARTEQGRPGTESFDCCRPSPGPAAVAAWTGGRVRSGLVRTRKPPLPGIPASGQITIRNLRSYRIATASDSIASQVSCHNLRHKPPLPGIPASVRCEAVGSAPGRGRRAGSREGAGRGGNLHRGVRAHVDAGEGGEGRGDHDGGREPAAAEAEGEERVDRHRDLRPLVLSGLAARFVCALAG